MALGSHVVLNTFNRATTGSAQYAFAVSVHNEVQVSHERLEIDSQVLLVGYAEAMCLGHVCKALVEATLLDVTEETLSRLELGLCGKVFFLVGGLVLHVRIIFVWAKFVLCLHGLVFFRRRWRRYDGAGLGYSYTKIVDTVKEG
jgi:hypothetical protein